MLEKWLSQQLQSQETQSISREQTPPVASFANSVQGSLKIEKLSDLNAFIMPTNQQSFPADKYQGNVCAQLKLEDSHMTREKSRFLNFNLL